MLLRVVACVNPDGNPTSAETGTDRNDYPFVPCGTVEIKGKESMSTYLLDLPDETERPLA